MSYWVSLAIGLFSGLGMRMYPTSSFLFAFDSGTHLIQLFLFFSWLICVKSNSRERPVTNAMIHLETLPPRSFLSLSLLVLLIVFIVFMCGFYSRGPWNKQKSQFQRVSQLRLENNVLLDVLLYVVEQLWWLHPTKHLHYSCFSYSTLSMPY